MAKIIGLVVALVVFGIWMTVVGNPHVVETVIGLVIATVAGIWAFRKTRAFSGQRGGSAKDG